MTFDGGSERNLREDLDRVLELLDDRCFGKYRGTVHGNEDPTGRGRLEVVVPAVMGSQPVWAMPCVPFAGPNVGLFALPPVGAGVWVEFEAGDPSYPIWTGCFWGTDEIERADARPNIRFFKTDRLSVRIDDQEGSVEIAVDENTTVRLTGTEVKVESIEITHQSGTKKTSLTPIHFDVHDGAHTVV